MSEKFLHGIDYSKLENSDHGNLTPLQFHILKSRLPERKDWELFLNPEIKQLPSPFLLPDLTESIQIIKNHIQKKSHILLFGAVGKGPRNKRKAASRRDRGC